MPDSRRLATAPAGSEAPASCARAVPVLVGAGGGLLLHRNVSFQTLRLTKIASSLDVFGGLGPRDVEDESAFCKPSKAACRAAGL